MRIVNGGRWRRLLSRKRVLIPLGGGAVLALMAWFVLLPWVVRWRFDTVLHQLQLEGVRYRVTRATPWTSSVRDIDGGGGNRIDELQVTYSVEGLWNRRVDNIRIRGLQLTADVRGGGVSIAPLAAILRGPPAASQPVAPSSAEDVAASASDWPFRSVRVEDSSLVVRAPGHTITLPLRATLRWPQVNAEVGALRIEGAIDDPDAIDLRFRGEVAAGADLTAVALALVPEAPVRFAGAVRVGGTLSRKDKQTTFAADLLASAADEAAVPKVASTNVAVEEGVFHIAGTFGRGTRSLKVTAEDVALAESSLGAKATGVSADLAFGDSRAATQPGQVVRFVKLSAARLEFSHGLIRFDFAPGGTLNVLEARAEFLGGVVSAEGARVAPGEPIPLTLVASKVELRELLKLLAQGKATGEGNVNGRLPLVIANGAVRLGEGVAEASAGGTLRITDDATLQSIAGSAAEIVSPAQAPQAQVRRNIVEALKDFQYESLVAQLRHEPDKGLVANVRMKGKGRTGAQQALDYDLRVTGLEDLLRSLLGVHRTLTREAAKP